MQNLGAKVTLNKRSRIGPARWCLGHGKYRISGTTFDHSKEINNCFSKDAIIYHWYMQVHIDRRTKANLILVP